MTPTPIRPAFDQAPEPELRLRLRLPEPATARPFGAAALPVPTVRAA